MLSFAETLNLMNVMSLLDTKDNPKTSKKQSDRRCGRKPRRRRLKGKRGRGTIEDDKCPVLGLVQRGGLVKLTVVPNVQQKTIKPIIEKTITKFSTIYTDEYNIYAKLEEWEYYHKTVNHSLGQYAKDEDGDGIYEVHCNTQECIGRHSVWSLMRSWLDGVAQTTQGSQSRKIAILCRVF